jgi:membrane protein DedA with SNARE-associated domain
LIELLSLGYVGVFVLSFALNMLPFMSPSNIVLAGALAFSLPWTNPLLVGVLVALASSFAKLVHFYLIFFMGKILSPKNREKLAYYGEKTRKIGPLLLFIAAASPIPDEPIVIPLGLLKYNPIKFFVIFLLGKLMITIPGAYFGSHVSLNLFDLLGNPLLIVVSLISTVVVTYVLMKVDLKNIIARLLKYRTESSSD